MASKNQNFGAMSFLEIRGQNSESDSHESSEEAKSEDQSIGQQVLGRSEEPIQRDPLEQLLREKL